MYINTKYLPKKKPAVTHGSDLKALRVLIVGKPTRYDIQKVNESVNAPDNIWRLRKNGWDIETERYCYQKPSGKKGWLGRYNLSKEHRQYAIDSGMVRSQST